MKRFLAILVLGVSVTLLGGCYPDDEADKEPVAQTFCKNRSLTATTVTNVNCPGANATP